MTRDASVPTPIGNGVAKRRGLPNPRVDAIMQPAQGETPWKSNPTPVCVSCAASTIRSACTCRSTPTTRGEARLTSPMGLISIIVRSRSVISSIPSYETTSISLGRKWFPIAIRIRWSIIQASRFFQPCLFEPPIQSFIFVGDNQSSRLDNPCHRVDGCLKLANIRSHVVQNTTTVRKIEAIRWQFIR